MVNKEFIAVDNFVLIIGVLSLLSMLYFLGQVAVQFVLRRLSGNWRWEPGSIQDSHISVMSGGRGGRMYKLTVTYSYSVAGVPYTGSYSELCASQAAEACLQSLQDMPPPVRYKPGHPQVSAMDPYRDAALAFEHRSAGR